MLHVERKLGIAMTLIFVLITVLASCNSDSEGSSSGTNEDDGAADTVSTACNANGGRCLPAHVGACEYGIVGEGDEYSCGDDEGELCCLESDAPVSDCEASGGTCVPNHVGACEYGVVGDPEQYSCGDDEGELCCL